MKKDLSKLREKVIKRDFIARCGYSNGTVRMKVPDGAGETHTEAVFAGGINQETQHSTKQPDHRSGVEYNQTQDWSLGSNTLNIEAKLRTTKARLGYIEVESHRHGGKRKGAGRKTT